MYDCITIGDIKFDTFVVIPEAILQCQLKDDPKCYICLEYGEKIPVKTIDTQVAGSAANVAVGLNRMKFQTSIVSVMGDDEPYYRAIDLFKKEKIDQRFIKKMVGHHSSFSVVINFKGEKTLLASHEPFEYKLPAKLPKTKWLYISELGEKYKPLYKEILSYFHKNNVRIAINPGEIQIKEKKDELYKLMEHSELIFLNFGEAETLTGVKRNSNPRKLLLASWQLNQQTVVLTDGKNGAYGYDGKDIFYMPIFPGHKVEATGAGDSFATGVLGATLLGLFLPDALKWGAINSSSVIGSIGPQKGLLSATEIRHRIKSHPKFKVVKI